VLRCSGLRCPNDLASVENCERPDPVAFAGALVDQLLAEIGPDVAVAWGTIVDRNDPLPASWFNQAISLRADRNPFLALIDWHELAADRPDRFLGNVHPNMAGLRAFTQMFIDDITLFLADPPNPEVSGRGLAQANCRPNRLTPAPR